MLTAVGLMLAYSLWWTKPTTLTSVGNVVGSKQTTETMHPVTFDMIQRSVHQLRLTGDATTTITMTVQPQRRGRVVSRGMEVDYALGSEHVWQRGSQATGPLVRVHVRE